MTTVKPTDDHLKVITVITMKLAQLGLEVSFVEPITTGPLITTYRFIPKSAAKVSQIVGCTQDIALSLKAEDVLIRRLPGEAVIGISVPNETRTNVMWRDTLAMPPENNLLPLNLGVDSEGRLFRDDFTKCPHLLVGGSTGGGKSIWLTSVIASLMYWRSPQQVQFILSDTKTVEFTNFVGSPHITGTIAHTMYETWDKMDWIIDKMEERLVMLGKAGYRDVAEYNSRNLTQQLPYYVLVIDELFDILGGSERGEGKIATDKLARIVAKSRAAGCHVLAATQRSTVDVVSGRVKTNFPSRLTFRLPNESDSRTIINTGGAEHLMPWGDMLYTGPASTAVKRLHSAFTELSDVQQAVALGKMKASMV